MPLAGNPYLEARYQWIPEHGYVLSITAERLEELESDLAADSIWLLSVTRKLKQG